MSNMSYCRFENTVADMEDCIEHLDDTELSDSEQTAAQRFIDLCKQVAADYADLVY